MILFTAFVIASAIVFCLALAASSSPVYGFNAKAELADEERETVVRNAFVTTHQGVAKESQPVVSAAGMQ
jgi:hypothetical protein